MKRELKFAGGMKKKFGRAAIFIFLITLFFQIKVSAIEHAIYDGQVDIGAGSIADFTWYRDGIRLTGDATFSTPHIIGTRRGSTGINLQTNTLTLSSDLLLGDAVLLQGDTGTIKGAAALSGEIFSLVLTGSAMLMSGHTINVGESLAINGCGNVLDFNGGVLDIAAAKTLTLKNIVLRNVTAGSITLAANTSKLVLDNVVIELTGNYTFATGDLELYGNVVVTGKGRSFILNGDAITLAADAILYFDVGTTFDVNAHTSFTPNATSVLHFNGCTIDIAGAGLDAGSAMMLFENKVTIQGANTLDGDSADIRVLSGARVVLDNSAIFKVN